MPVESNTIGSFSCFHPSQEFLSLQLVGWEKDSTKTHHKLWLCEWMIWWWAWLCDVVSSFLVPRFCSVKARRDFDTSYVMSTRFHSSHDSRSKCHLLHPGSFSLSLVRFVCRLPQYCSFVVYQSAWQFGKTFKEIVRVLLSAALWATGLFIISITRILKLLRCYTASE